MSVLPIYGEEDDDFAYQEEHIELESDNQEYDDLDTGEFGGRPSLIRAENQSPPIALPPKPSTTALQENSTPANAVTAPQAPLKARQMPPPETASSGPGAAAASSPKAKSSGAKRRTKITPRAVKREVQIKRTRPTKKAESEARVTKKTQPVRKKLVTKSSKRATPKKSAAPAKSTRVRKKAAVKRSSRLSPKRSAGKKRRRA